MSREDTPNSILSDKRTPSPYQSRTFQGQPLMTPKVQPTQSACTSANTPQSMTNSNVNAQAAGQSVVHNPLLQPQEKAATPPRRVVMTGVTDNIGGRNNVEQVRDSPMTKNLADEVNNAVLQRLTFHKIHSDKQWLQGLNLVEIAATMAMEFCELQEELDSSFTLDDHMFTCLQEFVDGHVDKKHSPFILKD